MRSLAFARRAAAERPGKMAAIVLLLALTSAAEALGALAIAPVVDLLVGGSSGGRITAAFASVFARAGVPFALNSVLAAFIAIQTARALLHYAAWRTVLRARYDMVRESAVGAFRDLFAAGWRFIASNSQGTMLNSLTRELQSLDSAYLALGQLAAGLLQLALYLAVPLAISWKVTVVGAGAGAVMAVPFFLLGRWYYRLSLSATQASNAVASALQEGLLLAKVALGFGREQAGVERLRASLDAQAEPIVACATLSQTLPILYQPLGLVAVCAALASAHRFAIPLSETAALFYALFKLVPVGGQIIERRNALEGCMAGVEQIEALRAAARAATPPAGGAPFPGLKEGLALEAVVVEAPGRAPVLDGVSLSARRGEIVALVGESGAGKTTAADLLAGLVAPSRGRVLADGVPLSRYDSRSYRSRVGYVGQENLLFDASVRDNLLWAKPDATEKQLEDACREAAALDFVRALPGGFDARVGDRGSRLSGGQAQRLALARALLSRPDLLVLDEATSALDGESEKLVQEAVARLKGRCAVVVVAHRLSSVRTADRIYALKDGRVAEEGSFDALVARGGLVARLASLQGMGDGA